MTANETKLRDALQRAILFIAACKTIWTASVMVKVATDAEALCRAVLEDPAADNRTMSLDLGDEPVASTETSGDQAPSDEELEAAIECATPYERAAFHKGYRAALARWGAPQPAGGQFLIDMDSLLRRMEAHAQGIVSTQLVRDLIERHFASPQLVERKAQPVSDAAFEVCPSPTCGARKVTPFSWMGSKWHRRCEACAQEWDEGGWLSAIGETPSPAQPMSDNLNTWFCALPEGRQAVLRDDKWMLANAAFEAGAELFASRAQPVSESDSGAVYAPLTMDEVRDLTSMQAGAPWAENVVAGVVELFAIADELRAKGERPVDPADEQGHSHRWNDEGERCLKCGDKDWIADRFCSVSDAPMPERAPGAPVPRDVAPYPAGLPPEPTFPAAQPVSEDDNEAFVTSLVHILETQQGDPEDDRYDDGRAEALRIWKEIQAVMPAQAQPVSDNGAVVGPSDMEIHSLYSEWAKKPGSLVGESLMSFVRFLLTRVPTSASQAHGKSEAVAAEPVRAWLYFLGSQMKFQWAATTDKREADSAACDGIIIPLVAQRPVAPAADAAVVAVPDEDDFNAASLDYVMSRFASATDLRHAMLTEIAMNRRSLRTALAATSKPIVLSKAMREHLEEGISNASEHDLPNDPDYAFIQEAELLLGPIYTGPAPSNPSQSTGDSVRVERGESTEDVPVRWHREWRSAFQEAIDTMDSESECRDDQENIRRMRRAMSVLRSMLATPAASAPVVHPDNGGSVRVDGSAAQSKGQPLTEAPQVGAACWWHNGKVAYMQEWEDSGKDLDRLRDGRCFASEADALAALARQAAPAAEGGA